MTLFDCNHVFVRFTCQCRSSIVAITLQRVIPEKDTALYMLEFEIPFLYHHHCAVSYVSEREYQRPWYHLALLLPFLSS